ncbi:GINS protein PSF2 [Collichthys lucidus]|uniref:GINS complex subunit 2 n=1 Tax=Collichthys lucidus TaxID=240159 RepID=A0A4U5U721_COLLU|nr:GINS protein PSF2 [Collichthys lucidus]
MDPSEVEFLAEKEVVKIIPNFSLDKVYLIGGDLGPFNPGLPVGCPRVAGSEPKTETEVSGLFLLHGWMLVSTVHADKLEEMRDLERKEDAFTPVPSPYYMELTKLLLNYASDNIPKADEIRTLVKDIWDTRVAKLRLSADSFISQMEAHAKLDNLTLMEINTIRSFLLDSLNCMYKLRSNLQPGSSKGQFTGLLIHKNLGRLGFGLPHGPFVTQKTFLGD